jgi:hypothetical protein
LNDLEEGFIDNLEDTVKGPPMLLKHLDALKDNPSLISDIAEHKIKLTFIAIYDEVLDEAGELGLIIKARFNQSIRVSAILVSFSFYFPIMNTFEKFIAKFAKSIEKKWPTAFKDLMTLLSVTKNIHTYPVEQFTELLEAFSDVMSSLTDATKAVAQMQALLQFDANTLTLILAAKDSWLMVLRMYFVQLRIAYYTK